MDGESKEVSDALSIVVTADGKECTVISAQFGSGPDVWEGYSLSSGQRLLSQEQFPGATQVQRAFDHADVCFFAETIDVPNEIIVEINGKTYDRVLAAETEANISGPEVCMRPRCTAKVAHCVE